MKEQDKCDMDATQYLSEVLESYLMPFLRKLPNDGKRLRSDRGFDGTT